MKDQTNGSSSLGSEDARREPFRLLHISDIHIGHAFQRSRWDNVVDIARGVAPDLIVVTGDLVNSPWRWMRSRVQEHLRQLSDLPIGQAPASDVPPPIGTSTQEGESRCPVWTIEGNHDTRFTGLVPVPWLPVIALMAAVFAWASYWVGERVQWVPGQWGWFGLTGLLTLTALAAVVMRICMTTNMAAYVGAPFYLESARLTVCNRVGILPIDSSTPDLSWARGKVSDTAIGRLQSQMQASCSHLATGSKPVWIALVHHHLLPLPYDSQSEPMMVMDNAGALLNELTRAGVRLVLHGHKHHQHFARIVVNPSKTPYAELAVLSAGTPTQGRNAGAFWHGFNVVEIDSEARVTVRPYLAAPEGGTFEAQEAFSLVPHEQHDRDRYRANLEKFPLACRRLLCSADINAYGDAVFVREYRSMRSRGDVVAGMRDGFVAEASCGMVEAYQARSLSEAGTSVAARVERVSIHRMEAYIEFPDGMHRSEGPIDFATEFQASNAYALNRWHFDSMYARRGDPQEHLLCRVPSDVALEELLLHATFPAEMGVPRRVNLRVRAGEDGQHPPTPFAPEAIVKIESQLMVQVSIPYPIPGAQYELSWNLKDNTFVEPATAKGQGVARALRLRAQLAELSPAGVPQRLLSLLTNLELTARDILGAGRSVQPSAYEIAVFAYQEESRELRYLVGNHGDQDARRAARYPFGLSIVGRAFKTSSLAAFRRPAAGPSERPWGYVLPDGGPVMHAREVPELAILAFPMAPPEALDWPYGVLQISTDSAACLLKTTNTASDISVERFAAAVAALTPDIEAILG